MITPRITVDGVKLFIVPSGFVFVRQNCVKFYGKRLSKKELILCCEYFISELKHIYDNDRLKIGFNLKCFKYYELSVYLHGLISLLCSNIECSCPSCFGLFRFSHLPHDILKEDKETLIIEVASVKDPEGPLCLACVVGYIPFCSRSIEGLKLKLHNFFPHWKSIYNIVLDVK